MPYGEEEKREKLRELGARIRAKREELGMSLEQVSDRTKIRSKYLIAVEEGDDSISPGKTYFRAFLKTYASFLGLDGTEFSNKYREIEGEVSQEPNRPKEARARTTSDAAGIPAQGRGPAERSPSLREPSSPRPSEPAPDAPGLRKPLLSVGDVPGSKAAPAAIEPPEFDLASRHEAEEPFTPRTYRSGGRKRKMPAGRRRSRGTAWVLIALVLAAALYYVAVYYPRILAALRGADNPPTGGEPAGGTPAAGGGPTAEPPTGSTPDPTGDPKEPRPPTPKVTREDPNKEKTIWSVDRSPVEVVLNLTEGEDSYCWVSVKTDGAASFERTLVPGEEVKVTAKSEITVRAGRPWVMKVQVNGQDMGFAGEFGPVKDLVFRSTVAGN